MSRLTLRTVSPGMSTHKWRDEGAIREVTDMYIQELQIKCTSSKQKAKELSGGKTISRPNSSEEADAGRMPATRPPETMAMTWAPRPWCWSRCGSSTGTAASQW